MTCSDVWAVRRYRSRAWLNNCAVGSDGAIVRPVLRTGGWPQGAPRVARIHSDCRRRDQLSCGGLERAGRRRIPRGTSAAARRVAPEATAYGPCDAPYLVTAEATWTDSSQNQKNIYWARELVAAMRPFSRGGLYLNFPGFLEEGQQQVRDAFGANYERLARVKAEYDPENVFRVNQNIKPAPL